MSLHHHQVGALFWGVPTIFWGAYYFLFTYLFIYTGLHSGATRLLHAQIPRTHAMCVYGFLYVTYKDMPALLESVTDDPLVLGPSIQHTGSGTGSGCTASSVTRR